MRLTEAEYQDLIGKRSGAAQSPARKATPKKAIRQSAKEPNKTERRFELERLEPWRLMGEITEYRFEQITLLIGNGVRYTPDYLTFKPNNTLQVFEVKGAFIREDAKIKLKVAASQFCCFEFHLAQYVKGEWLIERVLP